VKWERFVSKLQPGQKETWTAVISLPSVAADVRRLTPSSSKAGNGKIEPRYLGCYGERAVPKWSRRL
jgi:hypothetical protein